MQILAVLRVSQSDLLPIQVEMMDNPSGLGITDQTFEEDGVYNITFDKDILPIDEMPRWYNANIQGDRYSVRARSRNTLQVKSYLNDGTVANNVITQNIIYVEVYTLCECPPQQ